MCWINSATCRAYMAEKPMRNRENKTGFEGVRGASSLVHVSNIFQQPHSKVSDGPTFSLVCCCDADIPVVAAATAVAVSTSAEPEAEEEEMGTADGDPPPSPGPPPPPAVTNMMEELGVETRLLLLLLPPARPAPPVGSSSETRRENVTCLNRLNCWAL